MISNPKASQKPEKTPVVKILFLFGIIVFTFAAAGYVFYNWQTYTRHIESTAVDLAESAVAFLPTADIKELEANDNDIGKPAYDELKRSLMKLKAANSNVQFAYLMKKNNNKIFFLVDSESLDSQDYSPPGQEFSEASKTIMQPFLDGKNIVTEPLKDRWGTWVSVFVPVKDSQTDEIIAVFGMDYPADTWNAEIGSLVLQNVVICLFLLLFLISTYIIYAKNLTLKSIGSSLASSEKLFKRVLSQAPIGISIVEDYSKVLLINQKFAEILGRPLDEFATYDWKLVTHPDDLNADLDQFEKFKTGKMDTYSMEKRYIRPDNSIIWVNMLITRLSINDEDSNHHLCIVQDIQERRVAAEALEESERSKTVLLSNLPGMAYRCDFDKEWTMHFLSDGCLELTGYKPESLLYNHDLSYNDLIVADYRNILWNEWEKVLAFKKPFRYEYEIITAKGERKWVLELGQGVFSGDGAIEALEGIVVDINEQKTKEAHIKYVNDHDYMTGLYNRKYFEEYKERLDQEGLIPISVLVGDINGVRLINDAFGLAEGDRLIIEVAKIMQSCCREGDLIARTGGDEFTILMPYSDQDKATEMMEKIKVVCEKISLETFGTGQYINLSVGYATKSSKEDNLTIVQKEAENYMNKRKLLERNSYHNAILSSIMATMFENSHETEEHAQRLALLCKMIGEKLQFTPKDMDELQLFSMLHDLGKIGIEDGILNKPGALTAEEWAVMKTHPEIGYRIAMSSPELVTIAEYILTHHERWDGKGYPQGLKGEEIPLLSRVLAVSDSYDAMTQNRVYRTAISKEAAIEEITKNAGTQFDPEIVTVFIEQVIGD